MWFKSVGQRCLTLHAGEDSKARPTVWAFAWFTRFIPSAVLFCSTDLHLQMPREVSNLRGNAVFEQRRQKLLGILSPVLQGHGQACKGACTRTLQGHVQACKGACTPTLQGHVQAWRGACTPAHSWKELSCYFDLQWNILVCYCKNVQIQKMNISGTIPIKHKHTWTLRNTYCSWRINTQNIQGVTV